MWQCGPVISRSGALQHHDVQLNIDVQLSYDTSDTSTGEGVRGRDIRVAFEKCKTLHY